MSAARSWPVRVSDALWSLDVAGASPRARLVAEDWRETVALRGLEREHLVACRAEDHGGLHLPGCVKVRLPDPHSAALDKSPWGIVLELRRDAAAGLVLVFVAFGQRHPEAAGSRQASVYQRAHARL